MYSQLSELVEALDRKAIDDAKTPELELTEIMAKLLGPRERYRAYCEASRICLEHGVEKWEKGSLREAYRKLWSSTVLYIDCKLLSREDKLPSTLREYWNKVLELYLSEDEVVLRVWHTGLLAYIALVLDFIEEKLFMKLVDILKSSI